MFAMIIIAGGLAVSGLTRFTKQLLPGKLNLFHLFWIGFATVVAFSQLLSLFIPLNSSVLILWIILSLLGIPIFIRHFCRDIASELNSKQIRDWGRIFFFIVLSYFAIRYGTNGVSTLSWSDDYDTNLYHFTTIRWLNEYPAIPGLGNLHSRLGHTSGFLILSAVLDNMWWDKHSAWLSYGFIVTTTCIQWLWIILFPTSETTAKQRLFCLLTSPYIIWLVTSIHPTLYFDDIALLLQMALFCELLKGHYWFSKTSTEPLPRDKITWLMTMSSMAALGFSIKPIGAISLAFVALLSTAILLRYITRHKLRLTAAIKPAVAIFAIMGIILIGHISRNVILTGWLLYPAPIGNTKVEWAMPENPIGKCHEEEMQSVNGQYQIIKAWARLPGPEYKNALSGGFSSWLPQWRKQVWGGVEPLLLYSGIVLIIMFFLEGVITKRKQWLDILQYTFLVGLASANLVFWFLAAPDMRFGRAFFWMWMGLGGCMILSKPFIKPILAYTIAFLIAAYLLYLVFPNFTLQRHPELWHIGKAYARPTHTVIVNNGQTPPLVLNVPQEGDDRCGDADIPCTPYPLSTLQMRNPYNITSGFKFVSKK